MKKMIPVYILQIAMLGAVITFGVLLLRKADTIRADIEGIRNEQLKQPVAGQRMKPGAIPVWVVNQP